MTLLNLASAVALAIVLVGVAYMWLLALAGARTRSAEFREVPKHRFAILIPAHNEEAVIGQTLTALAALNYPRELYDVYVVADHCTDRTAAVAGAHRATCFEREDAPRGSKGAAVSWLLGRVTESGQAYDAYALFDADTIVDPDFLRAMDARLSEGDQAVQGQHRIRNQGDGWFAALTWAMFKIDNRVQNVGRTNLGLSAKLMGDSVCFRADLAQDIAWATGLTEDYELRLRMLLVGKRICYEPRAVGYGEAPASWHAARAQRARWLRGSFESGRRYAWKLLHEGVRRKDPALLDGAAQAMLPSFSTLTLISLAALALHLAARSLFAPQLVYPWLLVTLLLALYPFVALSFERAEAKAYLVILSGPAFIVWRTYLSVSSRFLGEGATWVRTEHGRGAAATAGRAPLATTRQPEARAGMRVLFLSQVLPYPPDAGPKIRSYYVLRWLCEQGHEVTLVSFVRPDDGPDRLAHLREMCHAVHAVPIRRSRARDGLSLLRSLATNQPFVVVRDVEPAMHRLLAELLAAEPFDVVHADQLWMAQYGLPHGEGRANSGRRPLLVLDQHNAVHLITQRLARNETNWIRKVGLWRESRLIRRFEADVCRRFDRVVTVTQNDRDLLEPLSGRPITVIPICIDPTDKPRVRPAAVCNRVLLLGTMFWPPNVEGAMWFAREVWPVVHREVPEARLTIVGKNPPPQVRALMDAPEGGVEVTGYVPDPRPYLAESTAFIVPLLSGGGMRVKIPDAWSWGVPVVSTTIGAEGLDTEPGRNILLADSPAGFAAAVISLFRDRDLAERLRSRGRDCVESHYNWRNTYALWDTVYGAEASCGEQPRSNNRG